MAKPTTDTPSRNALCPCGSGKKSKHCCGATKPATTAASTVAPAASVEKVQGVPPWLLVIGLLGIIAVAVYAMSRTNSSVSKPTPVLPAGTIPQPWQYDAATNQHWDPSHQHWHDGRPSASAAPATSAKPGTPAQEAAPAKPSTPAKQATPAKPATAAKSTAPVKPKTSTKPSAPTKPAAPATAVPKPWQFDPVENKHWDPTHQHWHGGPPPPQAPRP